MDPSLVQLIIFLLILPYVISKPVKQTLCPCDENSFSSRIQEFSCKDHLVYACILNAEEELKEICITPYTVDTGTGGCPYLAIAKNNSESFEIKFSDCQGIGCPSEAHERYSISELFKYTKCMVPPKQRQNDSLNNNINCLPTLNDPASYVAFDVDVSSISNNESDWMNTTTEKVPRERTEAYILFLLWLSGIMMLLLPMLATLLFYKIKEKLQEKYECCRNKDSKKKKKAKKKKREEKAKKKDESTKKLLK